MNYKPTIDRGLKRNRHTPASQSGTGHKCPNASKNVQDAGSKYRCSSPSQIAGTPLTQMQPAKPPAKHTMLKPPCWHNIAETNVAQATRSCVALFQGYFNLHLGRMACTWCLLEIAWGPMTSRILAMLPEKCMDADQSLPMFGSAWKVRSKMVRNISLESLNANLLVSFP